MCFAMCTSDRYLDLESGIINTKEQCKLEDGELGLQKVCIKSSRRRHTIDATIEFESANDCVKYNSAGDTDYEVSVTMPPASMGNPSSTTVETDVEKCSNPVVTEETLITSVAYEYGIPPQEVDGPVVHPRVELG